MYSLSSLINMLLAQTDGTGAAEQAQQVAATGMRWDGWLMLIFGVLLLYGGLGWCLWIAAGRGNKDAWNEEEDCE
jgi:hypothetical protein